MTLSEIDSRLASIALTKHDPEKAHSFERKLYIDTLVAISLGEHGESPRHLAARALDALLINFPRHMA